MITWITNTKLFGIEKIDPKFLIHTVVWQLAYKINTNFWKTEKRKRAHIYYSLWHKSNIVQMTSTMTRYRQCMLFMKSTWHVKILNCKIRILVSHLHIIKFSFLCWYKNISWFQLTLLVPVVFLNSPTWAHTFHWTNLREFDF